MLKELGEAKDFVFYLVGELSCVAEDDSASWLGVFYHVLQDSENEDGSLSHTGHGLAEYVGAKHCYRNASLLNV
jgi:hypothetical protein